MKNEYLELLAKQQIKEENLRVEKNKPQLRKYNERNYTVSTAYRAKGEVAKNAVKWTRKLGLRNSWSKQKQLHQLVTQTSHWCLKELSSRT